MKQAKQQYRSLNSEESWTAFTAVQQCSVQEQTVKANESYTAQADCAVLTQYCTVLKYSTVLNSTQRQ
jgi:hypothetical protein